MNTCKLKTAKPEDKPLEFVRHGAMNVTVTKEDGQPVVMGPKEFSETYEVVSEPKG